MVKVTERGWAAHFCLSDRCLFRRNTLIESEIDSVVVSTIGALVSEKGVGLETVGLGGRYYETMVFGAVKDGQYTEADVSDERSFASKWNICADTSEGLPEDVDNRANDQHEAVVAEMVAKLR